MNLDDKQKFEILKSAYTERKKEVEFWRERSWKVTSWLIGIFLAFSAAVKAIPDDKFVYLLFQLMALSGIATIYLHKNYKVYSERWQRLADIEEALNFFEKGVYINDNSLNPPELRKPKVTYKGTAFFITSIWLMAISSLVLVVLER